MALIGKYEQHVRKDHLKASDLANLLLRFKNETFKNLNEVYTKNMQLLLADKESTFKDLKRLRVQITYDGYPDWFYEKEREDNFSEVVNQLATVEAMIFILSKNPNHQVLMAHPTQTSSKGDMNSDLVLRDDNNVLEHYEISDVISKEADGNLKLRKDLSSLYRRFKSNKDEPWHYYVITSDELWNHAHKGKYEPLDHGSFRYYYELGMEDGKEILKLEAFSNSSKQRSLLLKEVYPQEGKFTVCLKVTFNE